MAKIINKHKGRMTRISLVTALSLSLSLIVFDKVTQQDKDIKRLKEEINTLKGE
jgi:hypothetical protein